MHTLAPRTRKRRREASNAVRTMLRKYDASTYGDLDTEAAHHAYRVRVLLSAIAHLNRALAMETNRAMGDPYATGESVRKDLLGDAYLPAKPEAVPQ